MKQFTMERAQSLVKRELGVDAASLIALTHMTGNPNSLGYGMSSGNQRIALYTENVLDTRLIVLSVTFENGTTDVTQYFYADTLEFADKATKARKWEDIEDLTEGVDIGMRVRRLQQDALVAHREHTTHIGALSAQAKKVWLEKMECICGQDFEKAAALRDTEWALRQELNGEKAPATSATPEIVQTPVLLPFCDIGQDTKEWLVGLWDEGDAGMDLNGEYQNYIATIDRWSAQDRPYDLGIDQDDEYRNIVDAIDTMLYYEAHPEEADQEWVLAAARPSKQTKPTREMDDGWDWEP